MKTVSAKSLENIENIYGNFIHNSTKLEKSHVSIHIHTMEYYSEIERKKLLIDVT